LYQNNGVGSGQEVSHFHLHVVPRHAGSEWGLGPPHIAHLERRRPTKAFQVVVHRSSDEWRSSAESALYSDVRPYRSLPGEEGTMPVRPPHVSRHAHRVFRDGRAPIQRVVAAATTRRTASMTIDGSSF
jgi:hypothetical protein